jgi:hypothetical protein
MGPMNGFQAIPGILALVRTVRDPVIGYSHLIDLCSSHAKSDLRTQ